MLHIISPVAVSATPIEHADLNDKVYELLKEWLVTRRLGPGEKLSLHAVADELGVSRSPAHHALTRLATEGLVSVRPRRGYYVTPLTAKVMLDAHDVRLGLELLAAEQTVRRVSPEQLAKLRRLMETTLAMLDGREFIDKHGYIVTNQAFHDFQIDLAGNRLMSQIYRQLSVNMLMERIIHGRRTTAGNVHEEHVELVAAFEAGDLERVQRAIRVHVETGKRLAVEAIERAGGML